MVRLLSGEPFEETGIRLARLFDENSILGMLDVRKGNKSYFL